MNTKEIGKNLFLIDLETGGFTNSFCSYIIKGTKNSIVESGPTSSIPNLLLSLKELKIKTSEVEYVAITHVHIDHGGGIGTLLNSLPNAKVLVHPKGMPHLINPEKLWQQSKIVLGSVSDILGKPEPVQKEKIIPVTNEHVKINHESELQVIEAPGHASHNLCFYETLNRGVFTGDTAGAYFPEFNTVLPTTPPPFYLEQALESIDILINLKPEFLYYSHFGKGPNAVQRLKDYKSQIQLWAKTAMEGVKAKLDTKEILAMITSKDEVLNQMQDFLKVHPIYSKTELENSVKGFIEYAEKTML